MPHYLRPAHERGHVELGWLDSHHSFSFGHYHDPKHMGFGPLRVINEDLVKPQAGFDAHPHRDMEIITYILAGALTHKDNTGGEGVIHAGEIQVMHAGSGIVHSEENKSGETTHLLQIWIRPNEQGVAPGYAQKKFPIHEQMGQWHLLVSPNGEEGALPIHQDAKLYAACLTEGELVYTTTPDRKVWVQLAKGRVEVAGHTLMAGDGLGVEGEELTFTNPKGAEILVFDLPAL